MSPADSFPVTVSIPEFCAVVFDHKSTNPSYELAKAGLFPVIETSIGRKVSRKVVPVRPALARIAGNDAAMLEALLRDFTAKLKIFRAAKAKRAVA